MNTNNQPLVSVPVITYNSSKFVLETLESIKAQTYQNIELIISDDCSADNTVELCQQWVEKNKTRFVRTQIITSETNTGVSANLNRAEAACQGEWIKGIAGDDLLMPNCIADCVQYVQQHPNIIYLFGRIEAFGANEERNKYFIENIFDYSFFNMDVDGQLERLVFESNCVPASTCFYNRQKAIDLGIRNDERIPLLEDWHKGGSMEYTPNPELETLRAEKEKNEKEIEQLTHKITRYENRQKYYEDGERKRRTHRLCTIAGTLESIAPEIKELDITEVMELLEYIFHKEEIQKLVLLKLPVLQAPVKLFCMY